MQNSNIILYEIISIIMYSYFLSPSYNHMYHGWGERQITHVLRKKSSSAPPCKSPVSILIDNNGNSFNKTWNIPIRSSSFIDSSPFGLKTSFFLISTYWSAIQTQQKASCVDKWMTHMWQSSFNWTTILLRCSFQFS